MVETSGTSSESARAAVSPAARPAGLQDWQLLLAFYVGVPVAIALLFGWMGATRTAGWDRGLAISYWLVLNFSGWWLSDLSSRLSAVVLRPWHPPLWLVLTAGYVAHGPVQVWSARQIIPWFQAHLPPDVVTKPLPTWGFDQAIDNFMPGIITWFGISYLFYAWLGLPRYGYVYGAPRPGSAPTTTADRAPRDTATASPLLAPPPAPTEAPSRSEAPPVRPRSPSFLSRIAEEIRAPVIALEAEQHYLRVFTEKGRDLILYRFSDAVAEMKDEDGAQVHRSWWVSRAAVERAVKENGAWRLILKDGAEVPVSRTYALAAKQAALIDG